MKGTFSIGFCHAEWGAKMREVRRIGEAAHNCRKSKSPLEKKWSQKVPSGGSDLPRVYTDRNPPLTS
jgi:hypothetical protein